MVIRRMGRKFFTGATVNKMGQNIIVYEQIVDGSGDILVTLPL